MPPQRILLLGEGDLAEETAEALRAADAEVERLKDPTHQELRDALDAGADAALVVSREDAWPLRVALLVRHLDPEIRIIATIFDAATGRELEDVIGNCTIASLADVVAPTLAGPCFDDELAAVVDGGRPARRAALQERQGGGGLAARGARPPRPRARERDPEALRP